MNFHPSIFDFLALGCSVFVFSTWLSLMVEKVDARIAGSSDAVEALPAFYAHQPERGR
jgi:hypothetical protein